MRRKISPVEAAVMEYESPAAVRRMPSFPVPILTDVDVATEVECMFAAHYDQSRQFVQDVEYVREIPRLENYSLHDALNEGVEPILACKEVRGSYHGMSGIDAEDPHMLTDESRCLVEYDI